MVLGYPVTKGLRVMEWHEINVNLTTKHAKFNVPFCVREQFSTQNVITLTGIGEVLEKASLCQVVVGGGVCGSRLLQSQSTTSGINYHLQYEHPENWKLVQAEKVYKETAKVGAKRNDDFIMDAAEQVVSTPPDKKGKTGTP